MRNSITRTLLGVFCYALVILLSLKWYDWKLLLLMFLFALANNLERT